MRFTKIGLLFSLSFLFVVTGCSQAEAEITASAAPSGTIIESTAVDWAELLFDGKYRVTNNTWNSLGATGNRAQRIFIEEFETGERAFGWNWDWTAKDNYTVVAYPEVVCGIKPWEAQTRPISGWLIQAGKGSISVHFSAKVTSSGIWNMAFSIWGYADPDRPLDSISHEIMIWNETKGIEPAGTLYKKATIDGRQFKVYVRKDHEDASGGSKQHWTYVAFRPAKAFFEGTLNATEFLQFLVDEGLMDDTTYISNIEWGNEVVKGKGLAEIKQFDVSVAETR